ncbi:prohibitin family protein [Pseudomonas aeruginosa]|uniref:Prohibitin family protein n=1 Tax=Pseudomonas aeruginosa TaxID=287 RepID=A0AAQ3LL54_PSEAI|nr:prohibitin family protein [Pseudomonas aeruginosa]ELS0923901.1 prohibitin family protein [Pseudomonas putida]EIU1491872.1 prohibitin family protein [Pseudomonas aeruginosa]EIU2788305.1 prohibitin family protein [Pseudomonas aeruginosa]EIU3316658.1 prohibitin family protein [Pseudomonas aeruginosa]EIU3359290.1 prohibitin family protein [Pseudomonas aeruginosa]
MSYETFTVKPRIPAKAVAIGIGAVALLATIISGFYTVDEKERGVLLRNGALVEVSDPGLHFKWPFIESVKYISVQNHTVRYESLPAYSKDQQAATLNVSVSWHVEPGQVADLYKSYGDLESMVSRLISRQVPNQIENTFGRYTAIRAVQERGQFVIDAAAALKGSVNGPVIIDSIQIENLDFSDAYERSIEDRMKAEVQVKTREQMLATEKVQAEIRVTQANAEAEAKLAQAKADAEATRLRGEAEAEAIKARAAALASNQNLVELTKAERWDGKLPTTMIPDSAIPFLGSKN